MIAHELQVVSLVALGWIVKTLFRKYAQDAIIAIFSWLIKRYILKSARSLSIWLHHEFGHFGHNALVCDIGDCARVKPKQK